MKLMSLISWSSQSMIIQCFLGRPNRIMRVLKSERKR
jgi:hypothetical protein